MNYELFNEWFVYDPETGELRWKKDKGRKIKRGRLAGSISNGYVVTYIDHKKYCVHRIAWTLYYGAPPDNEIDHINGVRNDNRISNLRVVTTQENAQNAKLYCTNSTGVCGVVYRARDKAWRARVTVNYRTIELGLRADFFEAVALRKAAEKKYGFHPNHGRA
jgi:hypothetical protein